MTWFHLHQWQVSQVNQQTTEKYLTTPEQDGGPYEIERITLVLYVCTRCGDSKTKTLDGLWEMEDLVPKAK